MTLGLAAYVIIVSGLFFAIWKRPAVALAGVLCMFGLEQWGQATTPFFAQHQTATNLVIGSLLGMALVVQFAKHGMTMLAGYSLTGWLTLILFLYAFGSAQWAPRADLSLKLWADRWPYIVTFIILGPLVVAEYEDLEAVDKTLVFLAGALSAFLLLFVSWEGRRIVLGQDLGNPLAPAAMAGFAAIVIILSNPWGRSRIMFLVKWTIVLICLALIVRSGSRGQLLGVLAVSFLCWPLCRGLGNAKQIGILAATTLFLCSVTSWVVDELWSRPEYVMYAGRWTGDAAEEDMGGRFQNASFLLHLWFGSLDTIVFGLGNSASYDPRILGIYPHLVPLEVLAEEGLIGLSLYLVLLFLAIRSFKRCFLFVSGDTDKRLVLGGLLGLYLFTFLLSLKQGSLLLNLEPFMLGIILGRCENQLKQRIENATAHSQKVGVDLESTGFSPVLDNIECCYPSGRGLRHIPISPYHL